MKCLMKKTNTSEEMNIKTRCSFLKKNIIGQEKRVIIKNFQNTQFMVILSILTTSLQPKYV